MNTPPRVVLCDVKSMMVLCVKALDCSAVAQSKRHMRTESPGVRSYEAAHIAVTQGRVRGVAPTEERGEATSLMIVLGACPQGHTVNPYASPIFSPAL